MTPCAPRSLHQACDSGRDAVATTVRPVSRRASWIRIDPTPPAPPTISSVRGSRLLPGTGPRRSNSRSHAVIEQVNLRVGALALDRAGIENLVARLEQADLPSDGIDHARGVIAQNLGL